MGLMGFLNGLNFRSPHLVSAPTPRELEKFVIYLDSVWLFDEFRGFVVAVGL
jgi:hypothetical protein